MSDTTIIEVQPPVNQNEQQPVAQPVEVELASDFGKGAEQPVEQAVKEVTNSEASAS